MKEQKNRVISRILNHFGDTGSFKPPKIRRQSCKTAESDHRGASCKGRI